MDAQDLNKRVKELMEDLSVKVFRTYNASITLNRLLFESISEGSVTVDQRKADYDRANKEVSPLALLSWPSGPACCGPSCSLGLEVLSWS